MRLALVALLTLLAIAELFAMAAPDPQYATRGLFLARLAIAAVSVMSAVAIAATAP